MRFIDIYNKLGKQTIKALRKDAKVFVNGEEYTITNIKYDSGRPIGFNVKPKTQIWFSKDIKPKVHEWIVVRDADGKEYTDHQWVGHAWYDFCRGSDGSCDGWRTDVDFVEWRYQEE